MPFAKYALNHVATRHILAPDGRSEISVREQFIGTWGLASWKIELAGGEVADSPLGPGPVGWITYQRDGRMFVALMRADRPQFASNDLLEATSVEIQSAFEGYISYCGSYEINAEGGFVIHRLALSSFPNLIGTEQKRYFELSGDRLTLKSTPLTLLGRNQVHRLSWRRLR